MYNLKINLSTPIIDGQDLVFKSPADCTQLKGLKLCYPYKGSEVSEVYTLTDAHGNNVAGVSLFASNAVVKVILDTDSKRAFVQNADTNKYLEGRLAEVKSTKLIVTVDSNVASHSADEIRESIASGYEVALKFSNTTVIDYFGDTTSGVVFSEVSVSLTGTTQYLYIVDNNKTVRTESISPKLLLYSAQELSDAEKLQARTNLDIKTMEEVLMEVPDTTALDFSNWANGYFTETTSDGNTVNHQVIYDGSGNITSIGGISVRGVY